MRTKSKQKIKHPYVSRRRGVSGGKPVITGTRIQVAQIAIEHEQMGWSPDEIIEAHPHLSLPQIHDALAYYFENAEEINAGIRENEELIRELRSKYPRSVLEEKRGHSANLHG